MTRLGVTAAVPGSDLVALRSGAAGLVVLPLRLRQRRQITAAPPILLVV